MSVAIKENLKEKLLEIFKDLPVESIGEVIDFAEFLHEKKCRNQTETEPKKERVFGMYNGQGWISDDFNDELPDEFWFGEDFGIIEKDNESTA
ncbi:MAG: DUF2281 domain-containing protein [Pyrinomonadaceae bacterium]